MSQRVNRKGKKKKRKHDVTLDICKCILLLQSLTSSLPLRRYLPTLADLDKELLDYRMMIISMQKAFIYLYFLRRRQVGFFNYPRGFTGICRRMMGHLNSEFSCALWTDFLIQTRKLCVKHWIICAGFFSFSLSPQKTIIPVNRGPVLGRSESFNVVIQVYLLYRRAISTPHTRR